MPYSNRILKSCSAFALAICAFTLATPSWSYNPAGITPQYVPVPTVPLQWTNADVDALVQTTVVSVPAKTPASPLGAPVACDQVQFLRFKLKSASNNAENADAALVMIPGILEGAGAFNQLGRQLVYMAATQYGKTVEVWAVNSSSQVDYVFGPLLQFMFANAH